MTADRSPSTKVFTQHGCDESNTIRHNYVDGNRHRIECANVTTKNLYLILFISTTVILFTCRHTNYTGEAHTWFMYCMHLFIYFILRL